MTEPVIYRRSLSIALVRALQRLAPAIVAVGALYVIADVYDVEFGDEFGMLAALVASLSIVLLSQAPRNVQSQVLSRPIPIALSVLARWALLIVLLLVVGYVTKVSAVFSRRVLVTWALLTPATILSFTLLLNELMRRLLFAPEHSRRAVMVGCNEASLALADRLRDNTDLCLRVEGFFDDRNLDRLGNPPGTRILGGLADLVSFVKRRGVDVIFIALPIRHVKRVLDMVDELRDTTASIYYVPDIFVFDLIQARTGAIAGMPVVAMCETPFYGYRGVGKRLLDVAIASVVLVLASPLLVAVAAAVKWSSPGPVIFRQRRYGLDGEEILVWKFRTMTVTEDGDRVRQASRNDVRVTRVGRVLRRYSLDELPQLFNVLQGTMSLVGPRPHAVAHNEEYRKLIKGYMLRHKVCPGITGLAQVSGYRGETLRLEDMEARVRFDLEYLRHWSPLLDLKILALTVVRAFRDHNAY